MWESLQGDLLIILVVICLSLSASQTFADITINQHLGYDSNPFRFNKKLKVESDLYSSNSLDLFWSGDSHWFCKVNIKNQDYKKESRADTTTALIQAGYQRSFSLGEYGKNKHRVKLSLSGKSYDKTAVSLFSGKILESNGIPIPDRYDYERWTPRIDFRFKVNKKHNILLNLKHQKQNNPDFDSLEVSNLDYRQDSIDSTWLYRPNRSLRYSTFLNYSHREYRQRLAADKLGKDIQGRKLTYDSLNVGLKTRYRLSKKITFNATLDLSQRFDNGKDYYNKKVVTTSFGVDYKPIKDGVIRAVIRYQDTSFDREVKQNPQISELDEEFDEEFDEEQDEESGGDFDDEYDDEYDDEVSDEPSSGQTPDTLGWQLSLNYTQTLVKVTTTSIGWYTGMTYYDFDSKTRSYKYDRLVMETGFKIRF